MPREKLRPELQDDLVLGAAAVITAEIGVEKPRHQRSFNAYAYLPLNGRDRRYVNLLVLELSLEFGKTPFKFAH